MKRWVALFLAGCASSGSAPDGGLDQSVRTCTALDGLPSMGARGAYDPARGVTYVFSGPALHPALSLLVEDGAGADSFPASADFSESTHYKGCPLCVTLASCSPSGCTPELLARAGHVQVDDASRDPINGHMKATVSGLEFDAWDFTADAPSGSGNCLTLDSATLEASWARGDGGVFDLAVAVDLAGPAHDLASNADLASNPDLATAPDLAMSVDLASNPDLAKSPDLAMSVDLALSVDLASTDLATACHPVINEVQAGGATGSDEWVEIYDPCGTNFVGWKVVYRSSANNGGGSDTTLFTFAANPAGPYLLVTGGGYTGTALADGSWGTGVGLGPNGGAVGLRNGSGTLIDSVSYATLSVANNLTETAPAPNPPAGQSIARKPNGSDNNDNSTDFAVVTTPTPKAAN